MGYAFNGGGGGICYGCMGGLGTNKGSENTFRFDILLLFIGVLLCFDNVWTKDQIVHNKIDGVGGGAHL